MFRSAASILALTFVLTFALVLGLAACGDDGTAADDAGSDESGGTSDEPTTGVDSTAEDSSGDGSTGAPPPGQCEATVTMQYDPIAGQLDAFPDDFYTVADDTPTGRRLDLRLGENVLVGGAADSFRSVFDGASTLDGFGTTAGIYVQFDGPIDEATLPPSGEGSGTIDASVLLVRLDVDVPQPIDVQWQVVAEDPGAARTTLIVHPLVPLVPKARYGLGVKSTLADLEGGCVGPSEVMASLLDGTSADPDLDVAAAGVDDVVATLELLGAIGDASDLAGAIAFTTQHTVEDSAAIATQIRGATPPTYVEDTSCTDLDPAAPFVECTGSFTADDYAVDGVLDESLSPQSQYDIPVVVYLPKAGTAPFPTLVYGHGLGGDRFQAEALAQFAALDGMAVVAIDAPKHGAHPDGPGFNAVLDFFGLSLDLNNPLDPLELRDNFRRGGYDRLQLVQMLLAGVDLEGSPAPELDGSSLHYLGVSLGGLMGPQLVAFAPEFQSATFIVPGARVSNIVAEGEQFAVVIDLFAGMATDGEIARFFPILQTAIDRGDPGTFARAVVDRVAGFDDASPQVLIQMVLDDDTVPNSANTYFARAVGVPHVGEVIFPIGVVDEAPTLPVSGNLDADHTGGSFQFDVIVGADGMTLEPATHGNVARSSLAQLQIRTFLQTTMAGGPAEILDPYAELGVR